MTAPLDILKKYWQFDAFRPDQEEIVRTVLTGRDVLVLMPTGGGKSLCFQVPAMALEGLALVISPLVSLMKDQVASLEKRGIKAMALTGGLSVDELSDLLDNAQFGGYKFLYLSPERLQSEWVMERIKALPVSVIAIDEAHCVSHWGHDFRPSYLKLSALKTHFPQVPFLALTATATSRVIDDMLHHLGLENPAIFRQSFERKNLSYQIIEAEDKLYHTASILKNHPEPAIIYVRNRKACLDMAANLRAMGLSATYYHGGLPSDEKQKNMQLWMDEKAQAIVATNAFGMGIDKANVRTVIHVQLPENLESYYQETGRAGRNGENSWAFLILGPGDIGSAKSQFIDVLPDRKLLLEVYVRLCNYLQIAYGEGNGESFDFSFTAFCSHYGFNPARAFQALQFLDRQGVLSFDAHSSEKASMQFVIPPKEVLRYMSLHPADGDMVEAILRTYPGIYEQMTAVNIASMAKKTGKPQQSLLDLLARLARQKIIDYHAEHHDASALFLEIREDDRTINRIAGYLDEQNKLKKDQLLAVVDFVGERKTCLNKKLLAYFGEKTPADCGKCSNCERKSRGKPAGLSETIVGLLKQRPMDSRQIRDLTQETQEYIVDALRELLEERRIAIQPNNQYTLI